VRNEYESFNSYFNIFEYATYEDVFYNVGHIRKDSLNIQEQEKDALYWNSFILDNTAIRHEKKIYGIMNLIGDLGGVKEIFVSLIGIIMIPISSFGF